MIFHINGTALNALPLCKVMVICISFIVPTVSFAPLPTPPAMPFLFLTALLPLTSDTLPEQTAFNYFATVLVAQYYPHAKRLYLTGHSEAEASLTGPFAACFPGTRFAGWWRSQPAATGTPELISYRGFPVFKRTGTFRRGGLQVRIYRAVAGPGGAYTHLYVYRAQHFVDHYLLKVSNTMPVTVEVCRGSEII